MIPRKLYHFPNVILIPQPSKFLHYTAESSNPFQKPFMAKPPSFLATNVIKSFFDTGQVDQARTLFEEMPQRDVVAWSAMVSGYTSCNLYVTAMEAFRDMLRFDVDVKPNAFTFSSILKACKGMKSLVCGELVHGLAVKHGTVGSCYVDNALMDMYGSCCYDMDRACAVFEEMKVKNSVSWTALIAGYTHLGDADGALRVFRHMLLKEAELNPFNVSIVIKACASVGFHSYGKQIHAMVIKHGFESSTPVMNSILDMCFRCIGLDEADKCFQVMQEKDIITWNTIIAIYEKADPYQSLNLYSRLVAFEDLSPTCFTLTTVVAAAANMALLGVGIQIHGGILRRGLQDNLGVANSLIDMYAKCGSILNSCKIFEEMPSKNVISWTTMMAGHGSHGHGKEAVELFDNMVRSGIKPDRVVFLSVLNACSHSGLVDEGLRYFKSMIRDYGICPDQEIYGCTVDLLGRAGRVKEAYELIESMPFMPHESVWGAFLGACKAHKLAELGKLAANKVLNSRPSVAGTYLALSNIYALDGKWGDYARIRRLLKRGSSENKKDAGKSWIEVKGETCTFVSGDKFGLHIERVYFTVDMLRSHMKNVRDLGDLIYVV